MAIRPMRNLTIVFGTLAILAGMMMEANAMDHPFLIVKKSDYAELQARAAHTPWKEMKSDAIDYINSHSYEPGPIDEDHRSCFGSMKNIVSSGALCRKITIMAGSTNSSGDIDFQMMLHDAHYCVRHIYVGVQKLD